MLHALVYSGPQIDPNTVDRNGFQYICSGDLLFHLFGVHLCLQRDSQSDGTTYGTRLTRVAYDGTARNACNVGGPSCRGHSRCAWQKGVSKPEKGVETPSS